MPRPKKYPPIRPMFKKNEKGEIIEVILDKKAFDSIFDEIGDLEKKIALLKERETKNKKTK